MGPRVAIALVAGLLRVAGRPAVALETDQYYAWTRPLVDSRAAINAKVNLEIDRELAAVNRRDLGSRSSCNEVMARISRRFRLFIFHDLELWTINSALVDRVPSTPEEELSFRESYLYHASHPLDVVTWMPPSPTIEVDGVRFGTDKLTHFLSEGWMYFRHYRKLLRRGVDPSEAERMAIDRGLLIERTLLGGRASGVLSTSDLEANYQGMRFFVGLCSGDAPRLARGETGWALDPPFDLADHVSPEWDESWQALIFNESRWRKVAPVLGRYCSQRDDPRVQARRADYARRDRETVTERRLRTLIDEGRLPDPERFTLDRLCEELGE